MTPDRRPTVADAKNSAAVTFPGQVPGTSMTGRLVVVTDRHCRIRLSSGAWVTRPVEVVRLAQTSPRVVPG